MKRNRLSVERWFAAAWPIVRSIMEAEDRLVSTSEGPAVAVRAACDQLDAAVHHAQSWLATHRCPDSNFGLYFNELISACCGLSAIMQTVTGRSPAGPWIENRQLTDDFGGDFMDRVQQASRAKLYLQQWGL